MFCGMASLSVSSALWLTATSANPIGVSLAAEHGLKVNFGSWLLVASVPALLTIGLLPLLLYRLFPPGITDTPDAPQAARQALRTMGRLSRDERITGVVFGLMIVAWILAGALNLNLTAVAIAGLGTLAGDQGSDPRRHLPAGWHAGDLSLAGGSFCPERTAQRTGFHELCRGAAGLNARRRSPGRLPMSSCCCSTSRMHYMFVSQSAQVLALLGVFLDVGVQTGVPVHLMGFALLFASSYFSTLTPQGGSQNVIFVASDYLTQR